MDTHTNDRLKRAHLLGGDLLLEFGDGSAALYPASVVEGLRSQAITVVTEGEEHDEDEG